MCNISYIQNMHDRYIFYILHIYIYSNIYIYIIDVRVICKETPQNFGHFDSCPSYDHSR